MIKIIKIFLFAIFFINSFVVVYSQIKQISGLEVEHQLGAKFIYQFSKPLDIERQPGVINRFNYDGLGFSYNNTLYAGVRYLVHNLFANNFSFALTPCLGISSGKFTTNLFPIDNASPNIGNQRFVVNSIVNSFFIDASGIFNYPVIKLGAGLWLDARLSASITQTLEYEDETLPKRLIAVGNSISSSPIRMGFNLFANYGFNIGNSLRIEFEPVIKSDLTALKNVNFFRTLIVGLGLNFNSAVVERNYTTKEDIKKIPEKMDSTNSLAEQILLTKKPADKPSAEILFKLNNQPTKVAEIETIQTNSKAFYPIKTKFYFNEISNSNYISNEETDSFKINTLSKKKVSEIEKNQLNILGYRLRKDTALQITLVNNYAHELQNAVTEKVKYYLVKMWGVSENRISLESKKTKTENDFIEIKTITQTLFAPIVVEWIESSYSLPKITITKDINSQISLASAVTTLLLGDNLIGKYYGTDEIKAQGYDALIDLNNNDELPNIIAQLQLKDSLGAVYKTIDTLLLKYADQKNIEQKNSYTFYFPVDGISVSVATRDAFISKIISTLSEGTVVKVAAKCSNKAIFTQSLNLVNTIRNSGGSNISFITDEELHDFIKVDLTK